MTKTITDLPGVGISTAEKLITNGLDTLLLIAVASVGSITEKSGVSEAVARKMIQAARDMLDMGFETAQTILDNRSNITKIKTGSESFDRMLDGGFETGAITEMFGAFSSAKTQIAHQLAVNLQVPDENNKTYKTIYIDTENTFRPERIIQMAQAKGLDEKEVLKNIKVARAYNSDHQMFLSEKSEDLLKTGEYKLLIIDSLIAHFRAEYTGRGTLSERQQKLNKHMHQLLKLADIHNTCVIVTNQVLTKPNVMFGDPTQAVGGHIVGHSSTFRIYLKKGKKESRIAKLIDSPSLPETESMFFVNQSGIGDEKE